MGDGDEERYTSGGDPNSAVLNAARDDMRPDFVKHGSGGEGEGSSESDESRNALRDGEESASRSNGGASGDSQEDMNNAESNVESDYANNTGGKSQGVGDKAKRAIQQGKRAKRATPLIGLLTSLLGGGAGLVGVQSVLPQSLANIFKNNFSMLDTINNIRGDSMLKGLVKGATKYHTMDASNSTIEQTKEFKFSSRQISRFNRVKIEINESDQSMLFRKKYRILVDQERAEQESDAYYFDDFYKSNNDFHAAYNAATATWRKSTSQYLSESIDSYYNFRGISRIFAGSVVNIGKKVLGLKKNKSMEGIMRETESSNTSDPPPSKNDNNLVDLTEKETKLDDSLDTSSRQNAVNSISEKAKKVAKGLAVAGQVANVICSVFTILSAFFQLVFQDSAFKMLNIAQQFFTAFNKAMLGDSEELGEYMTRLSEDATQHYSAKAKSGYATAKMTGISEGDEDVDNIDNAQYEWQDGAEKTGNALTSEGIQGLYSGNTANAYTDDSASQFNIFASLEGAASHLNLAVASFRKCAFTRLATDLAAFVGDFAMVVGCIVTAGVGCLLGVLKDVAIEVGAGIATLAITYVVSQIIAYALPQLVAVYVPEVLDRLVGEDLGNALTSAGNMLLSGAGQYVGGSAASESSFPTYEHARLQVVADNARYEREIYSPFDLRSTNTFFGSIANQLVPVSGYIGVSVSGSIKSFGNLVSSSVNQLLPTANALNVTYNSEKAIKNSKQHCPLLEGIGAVGDSFCNPYIISDLNTAGSEPGEIEESKIIQESLETDPNDPNGGKRIKENSGLFKWIKYCSRRSSPLGITDQNISDELGGKFRTRNSTANIVLDKVPIIGSGMNLLNDSMMLAYAGYITGEACVTDNGSGTYNNVKSVDLSARVEYIENKNRREQLDNGMRSFYGQLTSGSIEQMHDWVTDQLNNHYDQFICSYYLCEDPNDANTFVEIKNNQIEGTHDEKAICDNNSLSTDPNIKNYPYCVNDQVQWTETLYPQRTFNGSTVDGLAMKNLGFNLEDEIAYYEADFQEVYGPDGLKQKIEDYEKELEKQKYKFEAVISGAPTWEESRVYQRYIQDQAILEDMGKSESPVSKLNAKLNEELDNSYLGIMSRYTGMTKDYIVAVLDGMEVLDWIAQYDPTDFSPTPAEHVEEPDHQLEEDEYNSSTYIAYYTQTFFEDRRQRNFAA